ncbi:MAG: inositol monophosphatase [Fibrobacteria bacterium]|nr:inositol monophosphatase [Fibrobacteria bacterium]
MAPLAPTALDAHLSVALALAEEAGNLVLSFQRDGFFVKDKGVSDLVTEADLAAEDLIRRGLEQRFPEDGFLGEEGGERRGTSGFVWVVDPIDGTVNFSRGMSEYGVSIGLRGPDGDAELGVIRLPALNRTYWAVRGGGAFCDGRQLQVSSTDRLERFVLHESDLTRTEEPARFLRRQIKSHLPLLERVLRWRVTGAAVRDLTELAEGRIDAFAIDRFHEWDVLAGWAILREAGGSMMAPDGGAATCRSPSIVFHNGTCGAEIARLLTPPPKRRSQVPVD